MFTSNGFLSEYQIPLHPRDYATVFDTILPQVLPC